MTARARTALAHAPWIVILISVITGFITLGFRMGKIEAHINQTEIHVPASVQVKLFADKAEIEKTRAELINREHELETNIAKSYATRDSVAAELVQIRENLKFLTLRFETFTNEKASVMRDETQKP